jgi:hypothetical protein
MSSLVRNGNYNSNLREDNNALAFRINTRTHAHTHTHTHMFSVGNKPTAHDTYITNVLTFRARAGMSNYILTRELVVVPGL